MTRRARLRGCLNGFTLIELLLGVSLFSVVALCAYSTFWGGVKLSRYAQAVDDSSREIRWAFDLISLELENAVPYDFSGSYPERFAVEGAKDKITFLLAADTGLKAVSYYLLPPESNVIHKIVVGERHARNVGMTLKSGHAERAYYLVREETDFADYLDETGVGDTSVEIIAARVKESGLRFSYGYTEEENFSWKDAWHDNAVPQSVRVAIDALPVREEQPPLKLFRDIFIPHGVLGQEDALG